jgi:hypothetical protein
MDRGLSVVELLVKVFKNRTWYIPDFIHDAVLEKIVEGIDNVECYEIGSNLSWATKVIGDDPKVFYVIDYFGRECKVGMPSPPNTIVIRDSVWFPYPFSHVDGNQIWFNSLRRLFANAKGASVISSYRLPINEVPGVFYHPSLTWHEMDVRFANYYRCKRLFSKYEIIDFTPEFPTVFPMRIKNRDKILQLAGVEKHFLKPWMNKRDLPNPLYKELALLPIDSKLTEELLLSIACKIKEVS